MPEINLSKLSGRDLRRRLDSSRARGDAKVAYEILREMAARREGSRKRRAAEPHMVSVDLGDPLDKDDDLPPAPNWRPPARETAEAAAPPAAEPIAAEPEPVEAAPPAAVAEPFDLGPLTPKPSPKAARKAAPELPDLDLRMTPKPPPAPPRRRHGLLATAGFVLGIGSGLALGWLAWGTGRPVADPAAPPMQVADKADHVPAAIDASLAEPPPPPAPPVEALAAEPAPSEAATDPAAEEPTQPAETAAAEPERLPVVAAAGCAEAPTPADREICADPALQRLQRDLQRAYAEALAAHEDRTVLRQRQLAWRDARNDVTDPDRLARLYGERIARLHAAAAEARAAQR